MEENFFGAKNSVMKTNAVGLEEGLECLENLARDTASDVGDNEGSDRI